MRRKSKEFLIEVVRVVCEMTSGSPAPTAVRTRDVCERLGASPAQVSRALRMLTERGVLVRLGFGLYGLSDDGVCECLDIVMKVLG